MAALQEKDGVPAATGLPVPGAYVPSPKSKAVINCTVKLKYSGLANMPATFHHSTHSAQKLALWEGLIWRINRLSFKNAKVNLFSETREKKVEK